MRYFWCVERSQLSGASEDYEPPWFSNFAAAKQMEMEDQKNSNGSVKEDFNSE